MLENLGKMNGYQKCDAVGFIIFLAANAVGRIKDANVVFVCAPLLLISFILILIPAFLARRAGAEYCYTLMVLGALTISVVNIILFFIPAGIPRIVLYIIDVAAVILFIVGLIRFIPKFNSSRRASGPDSELWTNKSGGDDPENRG